MTGSLPALVLGPPAAGAAWQVLAASPAPAFTDAQQLRLQEIMVSLADWAGSGEAPIIALLPLDHAPGPALLLRAAGGSLPQANAMLVPADLLAALDGHAERLLPLLPVPDGSRSFGRSPVALSPDPLADPLADLPPLPLRSGWADIGLAWRDRVVMVPETADVLPTLATVLATAGPPEQRGRIRGWATTALLPAAGDFDPWQECQLLVLGPGRSRPHGLPHRPARFNQLNEPEPVCDPPPAWRAWAAFRDIAAGAPLLPWQPDMVAEPVPALLARLADHADAARGNRIGLVRALLGGRGRQGADLREAGLQLLAGWLEQDGGADLGDDDCAALGRPMLIAALASLDRPGHALAQMQPARALWLIDGVIDHPTATAALGCAVALWLAQHQPDHPALPAIISARLAGASGRDLGLDLGRLATPAVLAALGPRHADLALQLTAAGLRRPAANLNAIATSLAALRIAATR